MEESIDESTKLEILIKEIINSSNKQVANKIFDNFIADGSYSAKQIEIINRIKNVVFGKNYMDIKTSIVNVNDILFGESHPLANKFEKLEAKEQEDLIEVIKLIKKVEKETEVF